MSNGPEAMLALADGRIFRGRAFGAIGETVGEVVFNTAMTGYQEVLTDPSYKGQLVCMTYPEIGNVGVNAEDAESRRVYVEGFIVREYWERPSNWRSTMALGKYLEQAGVVGIENIDTRALVRHLRTHGAQEAVISSIDLNPESLVRKAKASPGLVGRDLVKEVTCAEPYDWDFGDWELSRGHVRASGEAMRDAPLVVALDYGIKLNILRRLVATGFRVRVRICLGHQLLGLALGGKTYKLDFGHHGANHPVMDLRTRRVEITSQNHGFAVDAESLEGRAELSHLNLNDKTVEGLRGTGVPFFSVQYHPEASPGPHDSSYLFGRFKKLVALFPRYGAESLDRIIADEAEVAAS